MKRLPKVTLDQLLTEPIPDGPVTSSAAMCRVLHCSRAMLGNYIRMGLVPAGRLGQDGLADAYLRRSWTAEERAIAEVRVAAWRIERRALRREHRRAALTRGQAAYLQRKRGIADLVWLAGEVVRLEGVNALDAALKAVGHEGPLDRVRDARVTVIARSLGNQLRRHRRAHNADKEKPASSAE